MAKKSTIKDVRLECQCQDLEYCPLEAILLAAGDRFLEQHKLVEYAKFVWSEAEKRELSWEDAYKRWVDEGFAKRFADIYDENKTYRQLRKDIFGK